MVVPLSSSLFPESASSMDSSDCSSPRRRERRPQGSPTTNLKPGKVSHKVKKSHPSPPPQRPPVIIYVSPPKAIHVEPGNFKTVVQRLTGASPESFPTAAEGPPESSESPSGCPPPSNPPLIPPPAATGWSQASYEGESAAEDQPAVGGGGTGLDRSDYFSGLSPLQQLPPVSPGYSDDLCPPFQEELLPPSSSHLFSSLTFSSPETDGTFSTITTMNFSTFHFVKEE
ncbi:unnamed protein product [Spirodela intermedia]|uniref:VQ domain-containing protein n=1 Tax=Spirodela intermedia TaxID=51605 RepID=A0A7I8KGL1_SPIIN|nr:unnamed protein product [Spirodela intermedia]